jgi:hypothetical protein
LGVVLHYVARDRAIAAGRTINSRSKQFGNVATATMPRCSIKKSARQNRRADLTSRKRNRLSR